MGIPKYCLLFVLVLGLVNSESVPKWPHPMMAAERYTGRKAQHTPVTRFPEAELLSLSREQLTHLRRVFKKFPIELSPLKLVRDIADAVHEDPYMDWEGAIGAYDQEDILERMMADKESMDKIRAYRPVQSQGGKVVPLNDESELPAVEDRPQTQGYEGCFADYDAYIGPFADQFRYEYELKLREELGSNEQIAPPMETPSWASALLDANAKQPPGVSQGRLHWVGSVELCADTVIQHNATIENGTMEPRTFQGMYARLDLPLDVDVLNDALGLNLTTMWPFALGVCAPDTCSHEDIKYYIEEGNPVLRFLFTDSLYGFTELTRRNVTAVYTGQETDFKNDPAAKAAIGILIGGGIIILFATCYDGWGRHREIRRKIRRKLTGDPGNRNEPLTLEELKAAKEFLYEAPRISDKMELAFAGYSMYSNIRNLFTTRREHGKYHVPVLDGLRVLSFIWLVKGLTYVYGIVYFECWTTDNLLTALEHYSKEWSFMSILGLYHANTALFFISGFVCVQMWYKTYDRNGKRVSFFMFIEYIILRWLAIMPPIMGMLMIFTCLYRYISEGPLNPPEIGDAENCRNTWWITFLFFHNVIKTEKQCFAWTWMFGAVWQLNLISIVILIPLVIAPIGGYILLVLMYIAHIVVTVIWNQKVYDGELSWFFDIVQTPWCNAGPYCIGMMMAMIMRKPKIEWKSKCQKAGIFFCWLFAIAGIMLVVYLPWDKFKGEGKDWPRQGQIAFDVLAPQIIALSLAWITWACERGYGGVVGNLLRWRAFTTLSRICLPAAVFMGPAMTSYFYGRLTTFYIHENHMGALFYAQMIRVFIFAIVTALFYQHPIARSMKKQMEAKTRLEVYLHCRHDDILDRFTGDAAQDEEIWEALEDEGDGKRGGGLGGVSSPTPLTSADVMRGLKPIGGYVPYQETSGLPEVKENLSVKIPITGNGVKMNQVGPYEKLRDMLPSDPPGYQDSISSIPRASNDNTTAF